eukprot:Protomagalhaensia_wolfi_Nauph_80__1691@NODE_204_length_3192_cov_200_178243_g153_i0_p1_GENE_NODE_204_length_3192_cov_200_178243_g153_i0NODE_204_length_3192_cov_200_178243_g153_i0_p1_ORF_typecomplete_len227_score55_82Hexapep_2/PF14602_6/0_0004Hexapep_2/PF14602_6/9e13Hexapep/PF00132_24/0_37Hexapep/PF00132_24/1_6e12Mac/PF12464_8/0_00018_NODE_204_length_3192_cov_200_178243_g153_i08691549
MKMLPQKPVDLKDVHVEEVPSEVVKGLPADEMMKALVNGEFVDPPPEFPVDRLKARALCVKFNATDGESPEALKILDELIPNKADPAYVMPSFWCDYGYNIKLGYKAFLNFNCVMLDGSTITIGDYSQVGPNCSFNTANHNKNPMLRRACYEQSKAITIGKDCWIGANVVFCPGVTVGDNCIIGAGSVVNRDVPSHTVAVGNPCKVVKRLYMDGDNTVSEIVAKTK